MESPSAKLYRLPGSRQNDTGICQRYVSNQVYTKLVSLSSAGLTAVNPAWLSSLSKGTSLSTYSKPFKGVDGVLMVIPRYGPEGWELPAVKVERDLQS